MIIDRTILVVAIALLIYAVAIVYGLQKEVDKLKKKKPVAESLFSEST